MKRMDWGDAGDVTSFGEVSAEAAEGDADVFLLVCPQNVVGSTIMTKLTEMVRPAAHAHAHEGSTATCPACRKSTNNTDCMPGRAASAYLRAAGM
jgi:hypothetical protein